MNLLDSLQVVSEPDSAPSVAGAGPVGPLGSNTDFAPPSLFSDHESVSLPWSHLDEWARPIRTDEGNVHEWESLNWLSLSYARRVCERDGRWHRLMACGVSLNHGRNFVSVHQASGASRAKVKGICRCGQTICCPVCSPRVSAYRASEVAQGYKNADGIGFDVYLVTLTAPHYRDSSLLDEATWWKYSWEWAFRKGKNADAVKENWIGYVNSAEMTWGERSGWHFHRHLLLAVRPGFGPLCMAQMRARWLAAVRRGHRDNGGIEQHAFHAVRCDSAAAAWYCSKIGAEMAKPTTKDSFTPLSLLRKAALERAPDAALWYEALRVCSELKISSCRWSRGFRAALGLLPEREDCEIAEDGLVAADRFLGYVTADQWRAIIFRRLEYQFLQVANLGENEANQFLDAYGLGVLTTSAEYSAIQQKQKQ